MLEPLYRKFVLSIAEQQTVEDIVRRKGWHLAQRFVAGETIESALAAVQELAQHGIQSNLDLLGEFLDSPQKCNEFADNVIELINASATAQTTQTAHTTTRPYVSVKLSSIGQGKVLQKVVQGEQGEELDLGLHNARRILQVAKACNGFVCLDMEDHSRTDQTLSQFRQLVQEFGSASVGTVLQSYLYRSQQDQQDLAELGPNLRFVKGAYLEPKTVAFPNKVDVDRNYRALVFEHLKLSATDSEPSNTQPNHTYTNIATHDENIIDDVRRFVMAYGIPKERFEFQMLYGIRRNLQRRLAEQGYTVRAYIPYGRDWYAYFSRRIAETPRNALFVLHGLYD